VEITHVLVADLEELITRDPAQVPDVPRPGDEHLQNSCEKDDVGGLELQILCCEESSIHVGDKQEDADQAQGEPFGGVGEVAPASHLT
jgi:hypothetical protein